MARKELEEKLAKAMDAALDLNDPDLVRVLARACLAEIEAAVSEIVNAAAKEHPDDQDAAINTTLARILAVLAASPK